ncbi:MAG: DUF2851 family protein [Bacteroidaceae bacterium]|nr:DUF2851 family protein [Bacteroidaceae bacterium]
MSDCRSAYNFQPELSSDASEHRYEGGERLLHYVWLNRLWTPAVLKTTDGKQLEIINPGRINIHAGPDFFNASVRIDGTLWVGNIEIHIDASDWYRHGHHTDERYDNVILHVCEHADRAVMTKKGVEVQQVEISVPDYVKDNYRNLLSEMEYPPCFRVLKNMPQLMLRSWLDNMCVERMEQKTLRIEKYLKLCENDWERVFFIALSRAFGFGVNSETFEYWASRIPLNQLAHHRDDIFQVEAFFFGQAGMISDSFSKEMDDYQRKLFTEYKFLSTKFSLEPMDVNRWKFLRMRPQNFPTIRLSQLAMLYTKGALSLSTVIETDSLKALTELLSTDVSPYWQEYYTFGKRSKPCHKRIQRASLHRLILNAICPTLFAYGRYSGKEQLTERAFDLLQQLPAESDHIIRRWGEVGVKAENSADSQALLYMYSNYCQRKDCLRCVVGREYLKVNPM